MSNNNTPENYGHSQTEELINSDSQEVKGENMNDIDTFNQDGHSETAELINSNNHQEVEGENNMTIDTGVEGFIDATDLEGVTTYGLTFTEYLGWKCIQEMKWMVKSFTDHITRCVERGDKDWSLPDYVNIVKRPYPD